MSSCRRSEPETPSSCIPRSAAVCASPAAAVRTCTASVTSSSGSRDGGFADFVLVTERSLLKLPGGLDPGAVAPHADAGITAYHAVRRLAHLSVPGTTAVVLGVGGVGHVALQLVRELGSSVVIAIDSNEERRRLAGELGADWVLGGDEGTVSAVRDLTSGRGADLVFDFVGTDQTHADSMSMLAPLGTYSIVGYQAGCRCPRPA